MGWVLKVVDYVIWILIVASILCFIYGCYDLSHLFFGR